MFSELPVGAIHAELKTGLDRKQQENHTGNDVKVKNILDKESLESSEVGILVDGRRYRISQLIETDIGRIWSTLTKPLELVAFMEKSRQTFPLNY